LVKLSSRVEPPLRMLSKGLNNKIFVKLKDGSEFIGMLEHYDTCMNLILNEAKEVDEEGNPMANFGKVLIRGSNIIYISLDATRVV